MTVMEQPPIEEENGHLVWGDLVDGRYEIERPLGHGGMGSVYLALDREFERKVAVKVLAQQHLGRAAREQRFDNEARYAGKLPIHANIATTINAGRTASGRPYIVMEYVEGPAINVLSIFEGRPLGLLRMLELMCGVAEALCVIHRAGVVHRDLTPANILVTEIEGRSIAKVIDFSHAAANVPRLRVGDPRRLTGAHETLGTAGYMPPEQVRSDSPEPRMDVFAFGVVLWELLSDKQAFRHLEREEYIELQSTNPSAPPPLEGLRSDLPFALYRLVEDCTRVHAAARPAASTVVLRLTEIIEELRANQPRPRSPRPSGGVMPLAAPTFIPLKPASGLAAPPPIDAEIFAPSPAAERERHPRRTILWIVLVVALLAAVAAAVLGTLRDDGGEDHLAGEPVKTSSNGVAKPVPEQRVTTHEERPDAEVGTSSGAAPVDSAGADTDVSDTGAMQPDDDETTPAKAPEERPRRPAGKDRRPPSRPKTRPAAADSAERCEKVKAETEKARNSFDWATVLSNTDASATCWSRQERKRLRVRALAELGRFAACVHEGSGSTDPIVVRQVEKCEGVSP